MITTGRKFSMDFLALCTGQVWAEDNLEEQSALEARGNVSLWRDLEIHLHGGVHGSKNKALSVFFPETFAYIPE